MLTVKYITRLLTALLALTTLLAFTACDARDIKACKKSLDAGGFSKLMTNDEFFALAESLTVDGETLDSLLIYDITTATGLRKVDENDAYAMKSETVVEDNGEFAVTYQSLSSTTALGGLTLPDGVTVGTSLEDTLEAFVSNTKALTKFKPSAEANYEMLLAEKDGARIVFRDMTKNDSVTGYRFTYQLRYTDEARYMHNGVSTVTKRTLVLSFDNTAEGHPITMLEIMLESRYRI